MATKTGEKFQLPRGGKVYPLNSTRLTACVVSRIAAALGLPKAPLADSRQMVEGSLAEEQEPRNVQVELTDSEEGMRSDFEMIAVFFSRYPRAHRTQVAAEREMGRKTEMERKVREMGADTEVSEEGEPEAVGRVVTKLRRRLRRSWRPRARV